MRRLISLLFIVSLVLPTRAAYVKVETDWGLIEASQGAFKVNGEVEDGIGSSMEELVKNYRAASLATVGIWATKYADRKAMKDAGLFGTSENYYYRHIRHMVTQMIIPRLIVVGRELLKHPEKAIYWGPFLYKMTKDVKENCMQFQMLVTNSKLTFEDIDFLTLDPRLEKIFDLTKIGDVDWKRVFDDLGNMCDEFSNDDLMSDLKNYFRNIPGDVGADGSRSIFKYLEEKPENIKDMLSAFKDTYSSIADGSIFKETLQSVIGDLKDSLAVTKLFNISEYDIDKYISDYIHNSGSTFYTQRWYIYYETVFPQSGTKEVVYEDVFDSRLTDEEAMQLEFDKRLEDFRSSYENDNGIRVYNIGKDEKKYYTVADEETVHNAASASFTVSCDNERELSKGSFNFKVNERFHESKMNDYAYPNTGVGPKQDPETEELEAQMDDLKIQMDAVQEQIDDLTSQIAAVQQEIDSTTDPDKRRELTNKYRELTYSRNDLQEVYDNLKGKYNQIRKVVEEALIDYNEDLDGPYRIITVKNELAKGFRIHWDDEGSWSGHTYTCYGTMVNVEGSVLRFTAEVSKQRGESWFLGLIRYHRAIVGVEWKLVALESYSDVVEVMPISTDMSDEEIANAINDKRSKIQSDYPTCRVDVSYSYKEPPEKESDDEALHLLWPSDRLAMARLIDQNIVTLHSKLALLEKWLNQTNVAQDIMDRVWGNVRRTRFNRRWDFALERWKMNAMGAVSSPGHI